MKCGTEISAVALKNFIELMELVPSAQSSVHSMGQPVFVNLVTSLNP
jgi:hypothetical protein